MLVNDNRNTTANETINPLIENEYMSIVEVSLLDIVGRLPVTIIELEYVGKDVRLVEHAATNSKIYKNKKRFHDEEYVAFFLDYAKSLKHSWKVARNTKEDFDHMNVWLPIREAERLQIQFTKDTYHIYKHYNFVAFNECRAKTNDTSTVVIDSVQVIRYDH